MKADYHVHSDHSNDSSYPLKDVIKDAIDKGIDEICITEHVDYLTHSQKYVVDYEAYYQEWKELKKQYSHMITMKFGIEFGIQCHTIDFFQQDFRRYPFDFVILSCHQVNDQEFWSQEYQTGKSQKEYNQGYYQEIYDVIQHYKDYSVLGHLDLMKRYDQAGIMDDFENEDMIKKILKQIIQDGKGLEVNTSYHRYHLPDLTPSRQILTWYYQMGGRIITFGSDSHEPSHLGFYIEQAKQEVKKIGFDSYCTFAHMTPIFHQL